MGRSKEFRNDGLELVVNHKEQIVYIIQKIEAPRSINAKAKRKADEVIIYGMNFKHFRERYPEAAAKYLKE